MNPPDLRRLRELEAKATPGPWKWEEHGHVESVDERVYVANVNFPKTDAALIAEMRNALPALLECVEAAEIYFYSMTKENYAILGTAIRRLHHPVEERNDKAR